MSGQAPRVDAFSWGRMEWLADGQSHVGADVSLARMTVQSGAKTPLHRHDNCSETIHVLVGTVEVFVGAAAPLTVGEGETSVIPVHQPHRFTNVNVDDAILMLVYSSGNRHYQDLENEIEQNQGHHD